MFYKSRKFQYAAVAFVASMVASLLPVFIDMTPDQVDQMYLVATSALVFGALVIGGHQWMDVKSLALLPPGEALEVLLEAIVAPPQEVNLPLPLNEKPL